MLYLGLVFTYASEPDLINRKSGRKETLPRPVRPWGFFNHEGHEEHEGHTVTTDEHRMTQTTG